MLTEDEWGDDAIRSVIDDLPDPLVCFLPDGTVLYSNRAHDVIHGAQPGTLVGTDFVGLLPEEHHRTARRFLARMSADMTPSNRTVHSVTEARPGGTPVFVEWTNTAHFDEEGQLLGVIASGRDITARQLEQAQLAHEIRHDALTGVLSRYGLEQHLADCYADAGDDVPELTLIYLDLDGFKEINDRHGHHIGDATLIAVGDVLRGVVRPDDAVGRLGGDEFVLVLHGTDRTSLPIARVRQITRSLNTLDHPVGVSVGLASPRYGESWAQLIAEADRQMFVHKHGTREVRIDA